MTRVAFMVVAALALLGCSFLTGAPSTDYDIAVGNGTTLAVSVSVNGSVARVFGAGESGTLPAATLGRLPWAVEARTASGRVLASMTVTSGSTGCTTEPGGGALQSCRGVVGMVDLSCGRFEMYTSGSGFTGGPAPGPGTPGDCEP